LSLWAIPFRFRVANIDQIFKLQKKRIHLLHFFLQKVPNHFFFILLQTKKNYTFQENDANIRFKEWNPDHTSRGQFASFAFWRAD